MGKERRFHFWLGDRESMRALRTWAGRGREEDAMRKVLGKLGRGLYSDWGEPP